MKKKLFQKAICLFLSVTVLFGVLSVSVFASAIPINGSYGTNRDTAASLEEMKDLVGVLSYREYLEANGVEFDEETGEETYGGKYVADLPTISVNLGNMIVGSNGVFADKSEECLNSFKENQTLWESFTEEDWKNSVYLPATGETTWSFNIPDGAASQYYIKIEYFTCSTSESSVSTIERKLLIDGKAPFDEASYIKLNKNWSYSNMLEKPAVATDKPDGVTVTYEEREDGYFKVVSEVSAGMEKITEYKISQDINGNSMSPGIVQTPAWNSYYCQDTTGYHHGYFRFFMLNGSHQITLEAQREPVIVKSIEFIPYVPETNALQSYKDVLASYEKNGYKDATGKITILQAEFPDAISDSAVVPSSDNSSIATYPTSAKSQLFNVIGKNSYNSLGQWAAYKFKVNETGLYKISMRYLQSALQGMYACRTIKLAGGIYGLDDGTPTIPFDEAYDAQFNYNKEWSSDYIGDSQNNEFKFYFEKGVEYTLYVECSLGSLKNHIQKVENTLDNLNEYYLKVLQLTGSSPDELQDYDFYQNIPEVVYGLLVEAKNLMAVKADLEKLCGDATGAHTATLETVAILLNTMGSDYGVEIAANLSNLKSYLGTLGTWVNDSKKGTVIIDSISIVPAAADKEALKDIPRAGANFFKSLWFEITSFVYSFFTDYDAMGLTTIPDENTVTVDVWLATGRDQSQIWRSMIDAYDGYTAKTGNAAALKLVTGGTLLPSILSGKGPDVYIGLASSEVINYAIRDAVIGISGNVDALGDGNDVFNNTYYTYKDENGKLLPPTTEYLGPTNLVNVSESFKENVEGNYVDAAMDTVTLLDVSYGIPQTMSFAMMFYRMDVLAELGQEVPQTWDEILSILPVLQTNNMNMGVAYISALDFMIYQEGGNMWKYTDIGMPEYAGAKIDLDSDISLKAFDFVCKLYSDYSFPISYDASNRFRTGEMPIIIGDYASIYNTLVVYATEIEGTWSFCPLPGTEREDGTVNYDSLAGISATVILHGCDQLLPTWQFVQWQTSADVQANYGNRMVGLIGPSAKYEAANINAIRNLSWTAQERAAIEDQMKHLSSIVNYPGSYIIARYMKFAFLDAVDNGANPAEAMKKYIPAINKEIYRKREEFLEAGLKVLDTDEEPPIGTSAD